MRRSLGIDPASNAAAGPPAPNDPLKGARQAIRSQAAAREYVERQLAHAEATIQDLRNKLHRARQEKDAAAEAARSALARKTTLERTLFATEGALASEKAAREKGDRALAEAQAMVRDLQTRLENAVRGQETAESDLATERQARQKAEAALREAKAERKSVAPNEPGAPAVAIVKRPVGRPRKIPLEPTAAVEINPVVAPPISEPAPAKTEPQIKKKARAEPADDQEPVQWWVPGWKAGRK
nr:hypothetical protein [uncultured Rhodopila sp.]